MNPDLGTELRSGRIISSSLETPVPTDPDMAQSSANDSDSNETSDISSQLSEIKESYERKINELQNEFSQLKDLMMAVISKTDAENRQSTSKGPSKPTHTVGLDSYLSSFFVVHNAFLFTVEYSSFYCINCTKRQKLQLIMILNISTDVCVSLWSTQLYRGCLLLGHLL